MSFLLLIITFLPGRINRHYKIFQLEEINTLMQFSLRPYHNTTYFFQGSIYFYVIGSDSILLFSLVLLSFCFNFIFPIDILCLKMLTAVTVKFFMPNFFFHPKFFISDRKFTFVITWIPKQANNEFISS